MHTSLFYVSHTAPPALYTLSLHDALPILRLSPLVANLPEVPKEALRLSESAGHAAQLFATSDIEEIQDNVASPWSGADRKSTRLNSSHSSISYAVFCLKKKRTASQIPQCW